MQAGGEATLAQLPHVDGEILKRLGRKRVRSLADLAALPTPERASLLTSVGGLSHSPRASQIPVIIFELAAIVLLICYIFSSLLAYLPSQHQILKAQRPDRCKAVTESLELESESALKQHATPPENQ